MAGRVLVITGAFGVLGSAVARAAAGQGARLGLIDFAKDGPAPDGALVLGGVDLADPAQAARAMDAVAAKFGGIDALLNIAGGFVWQTVADGDAKAWDRMFTLNLKTALNATKAALPFLIEAKGAIVSVGANAALSAGAGMGAYTASKAGIHKLTESLAQEMKGKVRVNAVLPSIIDTPQNRKDMPKTDPSIWVKPNELAKAMLFLASDDASAITGALVPIVGRV